ncbi:FG-GAP repeat protein [Sorangium sp. So ce204]|uniref:FG-GAP repeat protein n=1 Tax=Sorangium sp. So ce204 TaxID=3133288 RepID=UPI003F630E0C
MKMTSWIRLGSSVLLVAGVASCAVDAMPEEDTGLAALAVSDEDQLLAPSGASTDRFGTAVAISGDTVVVAAPFDDDAGTDAGAAHVFVRSGSSWVHQQTLTSTTVGSYDYFGISVAISGETIVVGAWGDVVNGVRTGAAYVFVRSGSTWTEQARLAASDGALDDSFGGSVGIDGDSVVVGSFMDDDLGTSSGSAYVFVRSGSTWTQQQKLTASDGSATDKLGNSVAISGDTVVAGSPDITSNDTGAAYVFVRSGSTWTQQQKLVASDTAPYDHLGFSVALSGDSAILGAYGANSSVSSSNQTGAAYVFVRSGSTWTEQQKLMASNITINTPPVALNASSQFGYSVAIDGDSAIVGSRFGRTSLAATGEGLAYRFTRSGSTWSEVEIIDASTAASGDQVGHSVSLDGTTTVVGAPYNDDSASNAGTAWVFAL